MRGPRVRAEHGALRARAAVAILLCTLLSRVAGAAPSDRAQRCVADSDRGQEQRDRGAFVEARASFRACATDECPALVRKDCAQWMADVEVNVPTVVLGAKDARGNDLLGVRILVDGEPHQDELDSGRAVALDPGPHLFRFEHAPDAPIELTAVLRTGEHNRAIVGTFAPRAPAPLPPPASPLPSPRAEHAGAPAPHVSSWAYVLGALGVLGLASFGYFGVTGLDEKSQLRGQCGTTCTDAQIAPLRARYIAADVSLGVGVVAVGLATWLFLHPSAPGASAPGVAISIAPSAHGATLGFVRSF